MRVALTDLSARILQVFDWIKKRRWIQLSINIALVLFLIVFVGSYLLRDWSQLSKLNIKVSFRLIAVSFLYYGVNYFLQNISWHVLFHAYNPKVKWWDNLLFYGYSHLARFLPTPVWYIGSRTVLYEQAGTSKRVTALTTLMETFLHVVSGLCFYFFISIRAESLSSVLFFALSLIPLLFVCLRPGIFQTRAFTGKVNDENTFHSKDVLIILFLFVLTWIISGPFYLVIIQSIVPNAPVSMTDVWKVWVLSSVVSYISSYTLGGIGMLREFSMTLLLNRWFIPPVALIITVMVRLVMTLAGVFWACIEILLIKLFKSFKKCDEASKPWGNSR